MLALPCIIIDVSGEYTFHNGTLVVLPSELTGQARNKVYLRARKTGWSKTEFDYECYTAISNSGEIYIFPALWPLGIRPRKKFSGYTSQYSKQQIEVYVQNLFSRDSLIGDEAEENLSMITHDLRRLSTAIYHQATEVKSSLKSRNTKEIEDKELIKMIDSIIAAQTMLRLRTDILDFKVDSLDIYPDEEVSVHPKVLKVVRCFRQWADHRRVNIDLRGRSFAKILGPNIFEILVYIILDNALKYSPNHHNINIEIAEGKENIRVNFASTGPTIENEEISQIFNKRYRGYAARKTTISGSGIGLFVAKEIVKQFQGQITCSVLKRGLAHRGVDFCELSFMIKIPIHQKTLL